MTAQPATDEPAFRIRPARTTDVPGIAALVNAYAQERILLAKERVTLYEDVQEFRVAEAVWPGRGNGGTDRPELVGCGALHVMWEDLAEVRTVAVAPAWRGRGVGRLVLESLVREARDLGVSRLFCLTFEVAFFARQGFHVVDGTPVSTEVFAQLLRSLDEGVAEFLDLARVKPNTLGNTRMIREL
jgi:amino-acid N-acetyltransferase